METTPPPLSFKDYPLILFISELTATQMKIDNEWMDLCTDFDFYASEDFWDITNEECLTETAPE